MGKQASMPFLDSQINNLCSNGTITSKGSRVLNQRLLKVMNDRQKMPTNKINFGVLDDASMQECQFSDDGRHQTSIVLSRITMLANILDCIL